MRYEVHSYIAAADLQKLLNERINDVWYIEHIEVWNGGWYVVLATEKKDA